MSTDLITIPTIEDISRRTFITGALASALLIACGDDDDGGSAASPTPSKRTIDTGKGSIEVPLKPEHVVAVNIYGMYSMFSLGMMPVGVPDNSTPWLDDEVALYNLITKVGAFNALDLEKIAGLTPDLILGIYEPTGISAQETYYSNLSAIAPTGLFTLNSTTDWAKVTEEVANALGLKDKLAALKKQYDDRVAAFKSANGAKLAQTKWAIANEFQTGWVLWYPDSSGAQVLSAAGVQWASAAAGKAGSYAQFSLEQINDLTDVDVLLLRSGKTGTFLPNSQAWVDSPTVKSLKVAQADHIFPVAGIFPYSYKHAISLLDSVEAIVKKL